MGFVDFVELTLLPLIVSYFSLPVSAGLDTACYVKFCRRSILAQPDLTCGWVNDTSVGSIYCDGFLVKLADEIGGHDLL